VLVDQPADAARELLVGAVDPSRLATRDLHALAKPCEDGPDPAGGCGRTSGSAEQPADVLRGDAAREQVALVHHPAEQRGLAARCSAG